MKHLINAALKYEVFSDESIPEGDGIECLTDFSSFPLTNNRKVVSAHLPFCTDWYGIWSGKRPYLRGFDDSVQNYLTYGRSREEIVDNVSKSIVSAAEIRPGYAILHASSANMDELFDADYSESSEEILTAFCEMLNDVYRRLGKMPVKLMFENQWWPGLRYMDDSEYRILEENLEFDNWGYCLDTGHLLVASKMATDERSSIELLAKLVSSIPEEVIDRIGVIHLHVNDSKEYIRNYDRVSANSVKDLEERIRVGYNYVTGMDQHRPFTLQTIKEVVDIVDPDFIVHEMGATDPKKKIADYKIQRALFD